MHRLSDVVQMPGEHASKGCLSHVRNVPLVGNLGGLSERCWTGVGIFL